MGETLGAVMLEEQRPRTVTLNMKNDLVIETAYRSCKMMNNERQVLVLHALKLCLLHKRLRQLLDQREIARLRKLALLVNNRIHTDGLQSQPNLGLKYAIC